MSSRLSVLLWEHHKAAHAAQKKLQTMLIWRSSESKTTLTSATCPSICPCVRPSDRPSVTSVPSVCPTVRTHARTPDEPTDRPTERPCVRPTDRRLLTVNMSVCPFVRPTVLPSNRPSVHTPRTLHPTFPPRSVCGLSVSASFRPTDRPPVCCSLVGPTVLPSISLPGQT